MSTTPQFGTAEYSGSPAADTCKACNQPITGVFYRAQAGMLCGNCVEHLKSQIPQDSHAAFVRGIVFGIGGFVLGLILYAGFTILTGIEIGFVSLAVGWLVGKAMMMGSKGAGGRRYQMVAVLLTYAAVSMAFIPIVIHYMRQHPETYSPKTESASPGASQLNNGSSADHSQGQGTSPSSPQEQAPSSASSAKPKMSWGAAIGTLVLMGLASPFTQLSSGGSGIIGLFILFIGMQFAWRITRGIRLAIEGPFSAPAPPKA